MGKHALDVEPDLIPLTLGHEVPQSHRLVAVVTTPVEVPLLPHVPVAAGAHHAEGAGRHVRYAQTKSTPLDELVALLGVTRDIAPRYRRTNPEAAASLAEKVAR